MRRAISTFSLAHGQADETDLSHLEPEVKQEQWRHRSETKRYSPDRVQVVHPEDPKADEAYKVGQDEGEVDHRVGRYASTESGEAEMLAGSTRPGQRDVAANSS